MDQRGKHDQRSISGTLLLSDLFYDTHPPGPSWFGPLDNILSEIKVSPQSLHRGDIFEIVGAPCTGKTHVLYFLALTTLVPPSWTVRLDNVSQGWKSKEIKIQLGGRGKSVVLFDCELKCSMKRMRDLLKRFFEGRLAAEVSEDFGGMEISEYTSVDKMVREALENLHIFRPTTMEILTSSITSLQSHLQSQSSIDRTDFAFVLIDGLSTLHLLPSTTLDTSLVLSETLKTLRAKTGYIIVLTSWSAHRSSVVPPINNSPESRIRPSEAPWLLTAQIMISNIQKQKDPVAEEKAFKALVNPGGAQFEIIISDNDVGAFDIEIAGRAAQ